MSDPIQDAIQKRLRSTVEMVTRAKAKGTVLPTASYAVSVTQAVVNVEAASMEEAAQIGRKYLRNWPVLVTRFDDGRQGEFEPEPDTGWCAWCEEAEAPAYLAHEGHDPECPFQDD